MISDFNQRVRVTALDMADFDQIYAARFALEPVGIAATVPQLDEGRIADLGASVENMEQALVSFDSDEFRRHHRDFHLGLTALAGRRISSMLSELWDHSERYRLAYLHVDHGNPDSESFRRIRVSQDEHRSILAAAQQHDAAACSDLLIAHLQRTLDGVFHEAAQIPRPKIALDALTIRDQHHLFSGT